VQKATFTSWTKNIPHTKLETRYFIGRVTFHAEVPQL
jgi:hypothetical protein